MDTPQYRIRPRSSHRYSPAMPRIRAEFPPTIQHARTSMINFILADNTYEDLRGIERTFLNDRTTYYNSDCIHLERELSCQNPAAKV